MKTLKPVPQLRLCILDLGDLGTKRRSYTLCCYHPYQDICGPFLPETLRFLHPYFVTLNHKNTSNLLTGLRGLIGAAIIWGFRYSVSPKT